MKGTPTLNAGEFEAVAITNSSQASGDILHYSVSVDSETGVDCLVFERDEYDAYAEGARDVEIVSDFSRTNVTDIEMTVQLDKGEYLFAVDYTEFLTDPGPERIDVELLVEIAEPP